MTLTGNEIREKFLSYFGSKKHARVASGSLLPFNDPTLFFVNAGMVPFKDLFLGLEKRDYTRATSSQKCMRVSGKHNDLENVGRTPRHHTFFEMLGNFSFGDYFKKDAISFAWEFLTQVIKLPAEPLWITVFREDDEAEKLWTEVAGVPKNKIVRLDEADNFWSMGPTGPCGPCSEIHVDLQLYWGTGKSAGNPGTHPDDFMEIWNLVFMQFNRDESGKMTPLPKPSIDTGMGLERLAAVVQKKKSNFETDLFWPVMEEILKVAGKTYGNNSEDDVSVRVIADHLRAMTFLISDGVQPANEGRGYVLRRIMRRAIRHGKMLGLTKPFIFQIADILIEQMKSAYPELSKNKSFIQKVIQNEEQSFLQTLDKGLAMIGEEFARLTKEKEKTLSGELAFKLYDTFGFPIDLTQIISEEKGFVVDMEGFSKAMDEQKERARANWKGSGEAKVEAIYHELASQNKKTKFLGYETLNADATVLTLIADGKVASEAGEGDLVEVLVDQTPFYGEGGGQVGDVGFIEAPTGKVEVIDTQKPVDGIFAHRGKVVEGKITSGAKVKMKVTTPTRQAIMKNHTATHIMHAALREILGDHVKQAGSVVKPDYLRFDFSHFEPVSREQLEKIENRVNEVILANYPVTKEELGYKEAIAKGALAFFGDKYGDKVRMVQIGPYSTELCGGTHLNASGEIGLFKITSESSVASGVRRIEAVTGFGALKEFRTATHRLGELAELVKATPQEIAGRVKKMNDRIKELNSEIAALKTKMASGGGGGSDYMDKVETINGVKFLAFETDIDDPKLLREFSDTVKNRLQSGIAVIAAKAGDKVSLIVTVSKDLADKYHAGKIIGEVAQVVGGKGGGRPDMAQAGGSDPSKINEALAKAKSLI
ncbi:alanine--tRNA ligase [bacterium]|nr:alanine--tRNA ligase [bacterium]